MRFAPFSATTLAVLGCLVRVQAQGQPKAVFAHFMVGVVAHYEAADWEDDITKAKAAGIDGFALNIGPQDPYTTKQIELAADAANKLMDFTLFLSFDYLTYNQGWDAGVVISTIKAFDAKAGAAQHRWGQQPLVSTFEGSAFADDWPTIRTQTGCFFIPDWTMAGPGGVDRPFVDGAFSWDAWPHGPVAKDTDSDVAWQTALKEKPYMMGISPWFYTNLPQYGKNWGWRGDDLWSTRWEQAVQLQPQFVQIITWNDFGESHYIGPIRPKSVVLNAERYVLSNPHDAWRNLLPYYIAAYKNGDPPAVTVEQIVYYHKPNPSDPCSDGGTAGNQPGDPPHSIRDVSLDQISVDVLLREPATVCVQIGTNPPTDLPAEKAGANHFAVPFNGQTGKVTVTVRRGEEKVIAATGTEITTDCSGGLTNWNAVVAGS